jgi:hypothetical protein
MENQRTPKQNKSLHLWFRLLANELNQAGLDMKKVLKPNVDIPWNEKTIKEYIWKPIQQAIILEESTTKMNTGDMTKIWEVINKHIGEKFGVEVPPIPSEEQTKNYLQSLEKTYGKE